LSADLLASKTVRAGQPIEIQRSISSRRQRTDRPNRTGATSAPADSIFQHFLELIRSRPDRSLTVSSSTIRFSVENQTPRYIAQLSTTNRKGRFGTE